MSDQQISENEGPVSPSAERISSSNSREINLA